nr:GH25 family lysozyme [Sphingomonas tagetis]
MRVVRTIAWLALAAGIAAGGVWWFAGRWAPSRADYAVQGIDVSDANGAVDWAMVKARDVDFAYARATAAAATRDARFPGHWAAIAEAGIRRGAIHVFSLCAVAADQAGAFVATVPRDPDALPAAIDLDFHDDCPARPDRQVVLDEVRQLAATIETHSGKPVVLRVSPEFEAEYRVSEAIPRPLWSVGNFFAPDYATRPWRMWRSSNLRRVDGIDRPVNWNVVAP